MTKLSRKNKKKNFLKRVQTNKMIRQWEKNNYFWGFYTLIWFSLDETSQVVQKDDNDVRTYSKPYVQTYSKIYYCNIKLMKRNFHLSKIHQHVYTSMGTQLCLKACNIFQIKLRFEANRPRGFWVRMHGTQNLDF